MVKLTIKVVFATCAVLALVSCFQAESTDQNASSRYRIEPALLDTRLSPAANQTIDGQYFIEFKPWVNPYENEFSKEVLSREWIFTDLENGFHRITNRWIGDGYSLAVKNDGVFNQLELAPSADQTSQRWMLTTLDDGYCQISSEQLGAELVLDVDSTNPEEMIWMISSVGESDGQHWELAQLGRVDPVDRICSGNLSF